MTFGSYYRDDHQPGYIYLVEAIGFHGILPGKLIRRCKIGLSRDPEARLDRFKSSQFPCDVKIITTIFVEDMAEIEGQLHDIFDFCNVKLEKSKEWFDLTPWQFYRCLWEFHTRETKTYSLSDIPWKALPIGLTAVFMTAFLGTTIIRTLPQNNPAPAIAEEVK